MEQSSLIKPNATAKELAQLVKTNDVDICKQVAQHPNTLPEILEKLFKQFLDVLKNSIIDLLLLENPNFYFELFERNPYCFEHTRLPLFYLECAVNNIGDEWVGWTKRSFVKNLWQKIALTFNQCRIS